MCLACKDPSHIVNYFNRYKCSQQCDIPNGNMKSWNFSGLDYCGSDDPFLNEPDVQMYSCN